MLNHADFLKNKTAVITGCSRGIGLATLQVFAKNGANIWACLRNPSDDFENKIELLMRENGVSIRPIFFDLTEIDEVKNGAKKILSDRKPVDVLVNNAGKITTSLFQMTPQNVMADIFQVNFWILSGKFT